MSASLLALLAAMTLAALAFAAGPLAITGIAGTPARRGARPIALALALAAAALYALLGDPGAGDEGAQAASAALRSAAPMPGDHPAYRELERHLARQPGDVRAAVLRARVDARSERTALAAAGYARVLEGPGRAAHDASLWVEYAEVVATLQGGRLSGRAQPLIDRALAADPAHPQALDLAGSAAWERGDAEACLRHWRRLLAQLTPGEARAQQLQAAIAAVERRPPRPGAGLPGPAQSPAAAAATGAVLQASTR